MCQVQQWKMFASWGHQWVSRWTAWSFWWTSWMYKVLSVRYQQVSLQVDIWIQIIIEANLHQVSIHLFRNDPRNCFCKMDRCQNDRWPGLPQLIWFAFCICCPYKYNNTIQIQKTQQGNLPGGNATTRWSAGRWKSAREGCACVWVGTPLVALQCRVYTLHQYVTCVCMGRYSIRFFQCNKKSYI